MAAVLLVGGLACVVAAVAGLAGLWWALLACGVLLAGGGVLTAVADRAVARPARAGVGDSGRRLAPVAPEGEVAA